MCENQKTEGMKNGFCSATALHGSVAFPFVHGSAAFPFVIPSEAEGSAVPRTFLGHVFRQSVLWASGPPKVMKNGFCSATALHGSAAFPFVIPSEAEGSAVPRTSLGNVFRQAVA
jgi:hypothetical protein